MPETLNGKSQDGEPLRKLSRSVQFGKLTRTSTSVSAKGLADFLTNAQEHEALLLQRLRDLEGKQVLQAIATKSKVVPTTETIISTEPSSLVELATVIETVEISRLPVFEEYR